MRNAEQRINILIGQLEGVKKIIQQEDRNCFDAVNQLKAVKSGVSSLIDKIFKEELDQCFYKNCPSSKDKLRDIVSEFLKK